MKKIQEFLRDEDGQSTTEYILILAVVVMIAMKFKKSFSGALDQLMGKVEGKINEAATGE